MTAVTILGRGDDWTECPFLNKELWGTMTCLLSPVLGDKPFTKVFAFDGLNLPGMEESLALAKERHIPVVGNLPYADEQYPLREVARKFKSSFLRPSISYMLAYAAYLEYDITAVYGIGGRDRPDYNQHKPYFIFWLGVINGLGKRWEMGRGSQRWLFRDDKLHFPTPEELAHWHDAK